MSKRAVEYPEGFDHMERYLQRGVSNLQSLAANLREVGDTIGADDAESLMERVATVQERIAKANRQLITEGESHGVR